ncbi:MAG: adenylyltransferase/cytidyltransferase family protein [Lachnospiraceae bacterium]|nr:adenylyltransferase/cytidyltransferase family protein [Lachnospiraceae bacterium]
MKKVITYGTFDLFHQGHYNILKRAKELGDYLVVGVTSEKFDVDRGKLNIRDSLATRMSNVINSGFVDEVIVEEYQGQKVSDVQKHQIDVFVVGSDWIGKFDYLKEYCEVVYLERTKNISSTKVRNEGKIFRMGLVVDSFVESQLIVETKLVSGLTVETIYSQNEQAAEIYANKEEIETYTADYEEFLQSVDIVYIADMKIEAECVKTYIEEAIKNKKHVVCGMQLLRKEAEVERLFELAKSNEVLLWDALPSGYLRASEQMIWFIKGNALGKLRGMNISITCEMDNLMINTPRKAKYLALYFVLKIFGLNIKSISSHKTKDYETYYLITNEGSVYIQIGVGCKLDDRIEVVGSTGKLVMKEDWWNVRYYKIEEYASKRIERHSSSLDGNGERYVFQLLLQRLLAGTIDGYRIGEEEVKSIINALNLMDN